LLLQKFAEDLVVALELGFEQFNSSAKRERRLAAFIIRRERPIVALDLGLAGPIS
jgi:hypothetical protein